MNLHHILKRGETFLTQNASTILTGVGVAGTVATAVLSGKAAVKAEYIMIHDADPDVTPTTKERIQKTWMVYIPPVACGTLTITAIVVGHRLDAKKAAALAAAYSLSEKRFQDYKDKALERLGMNKEQAVRDELAQDMVNDHPLSKEVIIGNGNVLCFDAYSGRYFESSVEAIRQAVNTVNSYILDHQYASLSHLYDEIGLPPIGMSDDVGWKSDDLIDVAFSTVLAPDKRPCLCMDFNSRPIVEYTAVYG